MQVARDLGGYSLGQADILRRAMGKKKGDIMERERDRFVSGAVSRNIKEKTADALFTTMLNFAEYCFNKSHSTAYAYGARLHNRRSSFPLFFSVNLRCLCYSLDREWDIAVSVVLRLVVAVDRSKLTDSKRWLGFFGMVGL